MSQNYVLHKSKLKKCNVQEVRLKLPIMTDGRLKKDALKKDALKKERSTKGIKGKEIGRNEVTKKEKFDKREGRRKQEKSHKHDEIREQDKIHKKDKKDKKDRKRIKQSKTTKSDLLSRPGELIEEDESGSRKPLAVLHGLSAMGLLGKECVRAMDDTDRHAYLSKMSTLCERLLALMHSVLVSTDDRAADELPSLRDHVTADLVRLRHLPLARRCIEMTLWHHVSRFNTESMMRVQSVGYGALNRQNDMTKEGLMNHDENIKGEVFNSFKNRYMNTILDTYQEDLDKIRRNEGLDAEHVQFLRRCLDAGADLYAHIRSWDRKHGRDPTDKSKLQNKQTDLSEH